MIAYVDSSVLLRVLLNQPGRLKEFSKIDRPISSMLLRTECLRTLDRMKLLGGLNQKQYIAILEEFYESLDSFELIGISSKVLDRAGSSFALPLGTLDAIHLSSALLWLNATDLEPVFMTHDHALGDAAKATGFKVLGH